MCVLSNPNSTEDTSLLFIYMVTGNNNSIKLIELFCGFLEIIHGKQLERYLTCSKGSINNAFIEHLQGAGVCSECFA